MIHFTQWNKVLAHHLGEVFFIGRGRDHSLMSTSVVPANSHHTSVAFAPFLVLGVSQASRVKILGYRYSATSSCRPQQSSSKCSKRPVVAYWHSQSKFFTTLCPALARSIIRYVGPIVTWSAYTRLVLGKGDNPIFYIHIFYIPAFHTPAREEEEEEKKLYWWQKVDFRLPK